MRTPSNSTTNSRPFPPRTREVQFDEKWSFVAKKERPCDRDAPGDRRCGDHWDHVALDPEHRSAASAVPGRRTPEHTQLLAEDFHRRTGGRVMDLMTGDETPAYAAAALEVYGTEVKPAPTGRPGRPPAPYQVPPADLQYATVHKTREGNRVVGVAARVVYGTEAGVRRALAESAVSTRVNTVFVGRHGGTDRNRKARKVRQTSWFSKDWEVHEAVTYFTMCSDNFCGPVRAPRHRTAEGTWGLRTPAMAAGLTDHIWPMTEWLTLPAVVQY